MKIKILFSRVCMKPIFTQRSPYFRQLLILTFLSCKNILNHSFLFSFPSSFPSFKQKDFYKGHVLLLGQSVLYTWDDPTKPHELVCGVIECNASQTIKLDKVGYYMVATVLHCPASSCISFFVLHCPAMSLLFSFILILSCIVLHK